MAGRAAAQATTDPTRDRRLEIESQAETSSVEAMYQKLFEAIINHRLRPGTKLGEEKLVEALKGSRTHVREALTRLAHEKLVTVVPYRGAFVAKPSIEEAREVLAARRAIEVVTVSELARRATRKQIKLLSDCVAQERKAWSEQDRRRAIVLSRNIHMQIAEMAGNSVLAEILRGIISRVSLVIALYDRPGNPDCLFDEHVDLVNAIAEHDEEKASRIIVSHVQHMEDYLNFMENGDEPLDLNDVFQD